MARMHGLSGLAGMAALLGACWPSTALAVGESVNGFPNWAERVIFEWMNRARCDPQLEMTTCGAKCGEKACYTAVGPLWYSEGLNHAARFHSAEMSKQGFFSHDSACTLVSNISTLFPQSCDGSASCACVGGTKACSPTCTSWSGRVKLFGPTASGEIIASGTDPSSAFYQWLYENSTTTQCAYSSANGHRWLILKSNGSVGTGSAGPSVGDFSGGGTAYKIPSAAHYPRQAASVDAWANWYDTAGPKKALINVDGTCQPMTLTRGSQTNGAWKATLTTVATGCHRYYFVFTDSASAVVTYPTTGSLGIGPAASCEDWNSTRPAMGSGCTTSGGTGGTGGTSGTGGTGGTSTSGTGGVATGGTGGVATGGTGGVATGGTGGVATGGTGGVATGGAGGTTGTGGVATGGASGAPTGGTGGVATGGSGGASGGTGGASPGGAAGTPSGGSAGSSVAGTAGATATGGASAGGASSGGASSGGSSPDGGPASADDSTEDGGCSCGAPGRTENESYWAFALGLALVVLRRRVTPTKRAVTQK